MKQIDVQQAIRDLKASSVSGPDGIHPRYLKKCEAYVTEPLRIIFIESLISGTIPVDWKKANVTSMYKKGDKTNPSNYHPVSLTSVSCHCLKKFY